jgi:fumarate reductase subunit C
MEYCVATTSESFPDFVHISSRTVIIAAHMSEFTSSLTHQSRWYMLEPRIVTFQMEPSRDGILATTPNPFVSSYEIYFDSELLY